MGRFVKALVTGGAGFIGSHIVDRLRSTGMEVTVIDDLSVGSKGNVPRGVRLVRGSILDQAPLRRALDGADVVFHNAARVSIRNSFNDVSADAETNVLGTVALLKESGRAGVKRFVLASSMAVYGAGAGLPLREEAATRPFSPYGTGKLAAEYYLFQLSRHYGFDGIALRYFNTYGPRQTPSPYVGVMTAFINELLGGKPPKVFGTGDQVRDFVHVEDVAEANMLAMKARAAGEAVNVASGKGTSVAELSRLIIERIRPGTMPVYLPPQPGEPGDSVADLTKARDLLGFVPRRSIEGSLDEVIDWNRSRRRRVVAVAMEADG